MKSPDISQVEILKNYKMLLTFTNGEKKIFDMNPYLTYPVFRPLTQENNFNEYKIVDGTIEWVCGAELSSDTFYLGSNNIDNLKLKEM